ncbi:hypothetical protein F5884DRAFT_220020 [Xylogone sp. PMI_703]|nr:hypothetical protein F5884DRAFT_220020 [Xylogone sp. PMI_703]
MSRGRTADGVVLMSSESIEIGISNIAPCEWSMRQGAYACEMKRMEGLERRQHDGGLLWTWFYWMPTDILYTRALRSSRGQSLTLADLHPDLQVPGHVVIPPPHDAMRGAIAGASSVGLACLCKGRQKIEFLYQSWLFVVDAISALVVLIFIPLGSSRHQGNMRGCQY